MTQSNNKKLYLVSYYFAPLGRADGVNRAYMVKYLCGEGWDVDVITGDQYKSLVLNFQKDESLLKILPPAVRIQRFPSDQGWLLYDFKSLVGIKGHVRNGWINNALSKVNLDVQGIIYAIVPPIDNAILAYKISQKFHCPFVLHYMDDVFDAPKEVVAKSDSVFCVTEQIKNNLKEFYNHPNIKIITNGYAEEIEVVQSKKINYPIKIVYAGSLNFQTRPEILAKAYGLLKKDDPASAEKIKIDFFGPPGYYYGFFLWPYIRENIQYRGYVKFKDFISLLPEYDLGFASTTGDISFCSKVYFYMNAGLPILSASRSPGLSDFVNDNGIGLSASLDAAALMKRLQELAANPGRILEYRKRVMAIRGQYSLKAQAQKASGYLQELLTRTQKGTISGVNDSPKEFGKEKGSTNFHNEAEKLEKIKKFWEARAEEYGKNWRATLGEKYLRKLEIKTTIAYIKRYKPKTVLDVGCGNGYSTKQYAKTFPGISFSGMDYSEKMIAYAKKDLLPNCHFFVGDIMEPNFFPDAKFDFILAQRCLQNLVNYESQYRAIKNLLARKTSHGVLFLMECSADGVQQLNHLRIKWKKKPLDGIEPWHNNFLVDQRLVDDFGAKIIHFSSTYMFLSRLIHPWLDILGYLLPPIGKFGYDKLYIIE